MKNMTNLKSRTLITLLVVSLVTNACTSYQPVAANTPEELAATLEIGDKVEVTTTDGTELSFKIEEISDEGLSGENTEIGYEQIAQLKVQQVDEEKVEDITMAVLAVPVVVVGIGLLALLAIGGAGIPGP
jgi:protein involved in polysaccharide export with SLBB domain